MCWCMMTLIVQYLSSCVDGTFVKKLLTRDEGFSGLSVFRDQYLLGCNVADGLYMYKI